MIVEVEGRFRRMERRKWRKEKLKEITKRSIKSRKLTIIRSLTVTNQSLCLLIEVAYPIHKHKGVH